MNWTKIKYWWKDCFEDFIIFGLIPILTILVIVGMIGIVLYFIDGHVNEERCRVMAENGNNVKMELHKVLLPWKICYIEVEDGKYVPYDRFGTIGFQ